MNVNAPLTIDPRGGLITGDGSFNYNGGSIAGSGTFDVMGALIVGGTGVKNLALAANSASLDIAGGSGLQVSNTFTNSGATSVAAGAVFNLTGAAAYSTTDVATSGTVSIGAGADLACGTGYVQMGAGAQTMVFGSLTTTTGAVTINDGVLGGSGTINGDVVSDAVIRAGSSPGTLTIFGDLTLLSSSLLDIELEGTGPGLFDLIAVSGAGSLDGGLTAIRFGAYSAVDGDSFDVISCGAGCTGDFVSIVDSGFALGDIDSVSGAIVAGTPDVFRLTIASSSSGGGSSGGGSSGGGSSGGGSSGGGSSGDGSSGDGTTSTTVSKKTTDPLIVLGTGGVTFGSSFPSDDLDAPLEDDASASARISCN